MLEICVLTNKGGLAQLARALPWHGRGHRFDSDILHKGKASEMELFYYLGLKTEATHKQRNCD